MSKPTPKKSTRLSKLNLQAENRNTDQALWADVGEEVIAKILLLPDAGAAVMLGRSKDGGTLLLMVMEDDEKVRKWFRPDEAADTLKTLFDAFGIEA